MFQTMSSTNVVVGKRDERYLRASPKVKSTAGRLAVMRELRQCSPRERRLAQVGFFLIATHLQYTLPAKLVLDSDAPVPHLCLQTCRQRIADGWMYQTTMLASLLWLVIDVPRWAELGSMKAGLAIVRFDKT